MEVSVHNDAVGRFTSSAVSGLVDAKNWATSVNEKKGRVSIVDQNGKV